MSRCHALRTLRRASVIAAFTVCSLSTGCWRDVDNTPACAPGEANDQACFCRNGDPGIRICNADGLGYGSCDCLGDAGAPAVTLDAARDATLDAVGD